MRENKDFEKLIEDSRNHFNKKLPFVLYRNPNEDEVVGVFQESIELYEVSDFTEKGFVFAPFDVEKAPILIREGRGVSANYIPNAAIKGGDIKNDPAAEATHLELISKGMGRIRSMQLQKVVLSRKIWINTAQDCFNVFERALSKYKSAFCYLWYHPKIGCWLGATPERLLRIEGKNVSTIALAGTRNVKKGQQPDWGDKEIVEQQLVTDYLVKCFSKSLQSVQVSKAVAVKAGNLWHLKSTIAGIAPSDFLAKDLLVDIHPTPAVCGVPKQNAYEFILANELYDREFYTGFLGQLNQGKSEKTDLYVNLRCLKFESNGVSIFVGGGITAGSIPEDEWNETQHKSQTMMQLL